MHICKQERALQFPMRDSGTVCILDSMYTGQCHSISCGQNKAPEVLSRSSRSLLNNVTLSWFIQIHDNSEGILGLRAF